ncbi:LysR family transcriptional regulator [Neiella sp. HB171785]|uniref:LysR family transcriptional regulator n=1 Tax=Neiella litorisoli TaxID=2771431 RepID=A0A8J6UIP5_9GAMM|nr:LysR family transcriptional regulator [Neiella litorisoli]MBD1388758.1 LysR family transcriptional regulator [Neiella litorisoli]
MRPLSLDNLRTLVTVIELGGYAKAGNKLGRSQPAVSLQIKKLEDQLGKPLFTKEGQRHVPNQDGLFLYKKARDMLSINDELLNHFRETPLRGRLRLGIPSEFATTLLPGIIGEFNQLYPDVALEITSSLSKELLNEPKSEQFDLILALINPEQATDGELVLEDDLVWVGSARHSLPHAPLPLVLAPDGCVYRSRALKRLQEQQVNWRIAYTNADLYGLTAAIQQGLGVTALAKTSVPLELELIHHPSLPALGKIKICLFSQKTSHPQAAEKLAQFIKLRLQR